jgi:hypothetical protein
MFDDSSYAAQSLVPKKGELRSLEDTRAELRAKYQREPTKGLARMIQQLEAEITIRRRRSKRAS